MAKRKQAAGKATNPRPVTAATSAPQVAPVAATAENIPAPKAAAPGTVSRKEMLREQAIRKQRQQNMWLAIAGAVIVVLIGVGIYIGYRNSLPVVGETTFPTQGNLHIPLGSVASQPYNSTPPTTGPHYENLAAWGIQSENVRYEHLIHNLEDSGVVVYYQCEDECPDLVAELESILDPYITADRNVVLTRNNPDWLENGQPMHKDMGARIALTTWRKLLLMEEVNADTIRTFIEKYEGIDHHRG